MKRIILFAFLLTSIFSYSQNTVNLVKGRWEYAHLFGDTSLRVPLDTFSNAVIGSIARKGTSLYIKGGAYWTAVTGAAGTGVWGFVSGTITDQTDLIAKFGSKYDTATRKMDTLYTLNDSMFIYKINGRLDTFKARGAIVNFNGRVGSIVLTSLDVTNALGYTPSNLPSVVNSLQVINSGGAVSFGSGTYASRPSASIYGRFYAATDSAKLYFDNSSVWITIGGGTSGGGGAFYDSTLMASVKRLKDTATVLRALIAAIGPSGVTDTTAVMRKANNLSDVVSVSASRTNLGLGTSAVLNAPASGNATVGETVKGNDTRLTDSRTPTGSAGGDLTGSTFPNPTLAASGATAGSYTFISATINAKGIITAISSGTPIFYDSTLMASTKRLKDTAAAIRAAFPAVGGSSDYTVSTAPNTANYTTTTSTYIILSDLTGQANRTVTLPSSPTSGRNYIYDNQNDVASGFTWTFAGGTVKDNGGNTITTLVDKTPYHLVYTGTNYRIIN